MNEATAATVRDFKDWLVGKDPTVNIRGESYRLEERRKAGLIPLPESQQDDSRANATSTRGKRTL